VFLIGDSVAHDAAVGVFEAVEATGVVSTESLFPPLFGLTGSYPWREAIRVAVSRQRTEVAILFLGGGWDQARAVADPEAYRSIVTEAVDALASSGARVLVIGTPPLPELSMTDSNRGVMNEVFRSMEERRPGRAFYVDPDPALGLTTAGGYTEHLPTADGRVARIRKPNAHICPEGAARLGNELRKALARLHPLPPPDPGWYWGPWRNDVQYTSSPPGSCDFFATRVF
jgi:hypothetical protein